MKAIWDDRLAEVWAAPGKAGAGVVIGTGTVLTARHLLADAVRGGDIRARVVRPGVSTGEWFPMELLAEDVAWDVAVLRAAPVSGQGPPRWLWPSSSSPKFVRLGTAAELGCEAVGFPQSEVTRYERKGATVRQTEQVRGALTPAGQAKEPLDVGHQLPRRWVPLDVDGPTPGALADWAGMSGAGVVLPDQRLAGTVVAAEVKHQLRRLYVVLIADILEHSRVIADALSAALGFRAVAEARAAQLYRSVLRDPCIGPDGLPVCVQEASLGAFGVRVAGIPGESEFLDYASRDDDRELRDRMRAAQASGRMLLVVGGSAGGKSRSAAEAARTLFGEYRLLWPRHTALARVLDLPATDISPALVWLDDAERYDERAFRDTVESLRQSSIMVVATIRRGELQARMPRADRRSALAEALTDRRLVTEMPWPTNWSASERASVTGQVHDQSLLRAVREGASPSEWIVAGPDLKTRLDDAKADDERPARYALVRAVLDWYRTGTAQTISTATAGHLIQGYLPNHIGPDDFSDALSWAFESVLGTARTTSQSLLTETPDGDGLLPHDYIQDLDARGEQQPIPENVLEEALRQAPAGHTRLTIGEAAHDQGSAKVASSAFLPPPAATPDEALTRHEFPERTAPNTRHSPYRGLMPFSEADSEVFYGREQLTAELTAALSTRLEQGGPLVVTGASGAGKSSLLRAGLLPVLARGTRFPGSQGWPRMILQPARHPLAELSAQVAIMAGGDAAAILSRLAGDPGQAHIVIEQAVAAERASRADHGDARLVLIADQFEQIFTLSTDQAAETERRAFITALCAAAINPAGPLGRPPALVILSVRGDYIDRITAYPELARAARDGMFVVSPMTDSDLYLAVTRPAAAAGLTIEPALADTIRADLRGAAGNGGAVGLLPLLSQAMLLTWENREGDRLTKQGYEMAGGVSLAVQVSADNVYDALSTEQRVLAQSLLPAMTVVGSDGRLTRRPVDRTDLYARHSPSERAQIDAVLEAFAARRLIVLDSDSAELAHEALIAAWPRLRTWLAEDQASLILYSEFADAAAAWHDHDRDASFLYAGARLASLEDASKRWAADPVRFPALTDAQKAFIRASRRSAYRSVRRRRAATAILAALLIASVTLATVALEQRNTAVQAARFTVSTQLVAKSETLITADPVLSALLAAAAWRFSPTTEARQAMQGVITEASQVILYHGARAVTGVAFGLDGKVLATASADGTARLWSAATHRQIGAPLAAGTGALTGVAFSPDGKVLATASADGTARLWNVATHRQIGAPLAAGTGALTGVAFSPDGKVVATANADGTARLWNVATHRQIGPPLAAGTGALTGVAFSPDGKVVATASADGTARLWNVATHRQIGPSLAAGTGAVMGVAFGLHGEVLATASADGTARLWNVATQRQIGPPLPAGSLAVMGVAFSPDGEVLATASADGTARLWNVVTHRQIGPSLAAGAKAVTGVAFGLDGEVLATASADGTARLLPLTYRGNLLGRVCAVAGRSLTPSEWNNYVPTEPFEQLCP